MSLGQCLSLQRDTREGWPQCCYDGCESGLWRLLLTTRTLDCALKTTGSKRRHWRKTKAPSVFSPLADKVATFYRPTNASKRFPKAFIRQSKEQSVKSTPLHALFCLLLLWRFLSASAEGHMLILLVLLLLKCSSLLIFLSLRPHYFALFCYIILTMTFCAPRSLGTGLHSDKNYLAGFVQFQDITLNLHSPSIEKTNALWVSAVFEIRDEFASLLSPSINRGASQSNLFLLPLWKCHKMLVQFQEREFRQRRHTENLAEATNPQREDRTSPLSKTRVVNELPATGSRLAHGLRTDQ